MPAVFAGEPTAQVKVNAHELCRDGEMPKNALGQGLLGHGYASRDHCEKVNLKESDDIDAYSLTIETLTHSTSVECHGIAVYANELCAGKADVVIPWSGNEATVDSQCFSSFVFEESKYLTLKLVCEDAPVEAKGNEDYLDAAKAAAGIP